MNKNLRVFVSTTHYMFVGEEQKLAFEAVLEAGNLPMNMELCPTAIDLDNSSLINLINTANVYLLVIDCDCGDNDREINYLIWEYSYAISKIPVFVIFLNNGSNDLKLYNKFKPPIPPKK